MASVVRHRSVEMVEALYSMNKVCVGYTVILSCDTTGHYLVHTHKTLCQKNLVWSWLIPSIPIVCNSMHSGMLLPPLT